MLWVSFQEKKKKNMNIYVYIHIHSSKNITHKITYDVLQPKGLTQINTSRTNPSLQETQVRKE